MADAAAARTVNEYLRELKETREGKPAQVQQGLDIYVELWQQVVKKGIIDPEDSIDAALAKIDRAGGLYAAAESETKEGTNAAPDTPP
jgi:hypothetical protein